MSFIPCICDCVYQNDGVCSLEQAGRMGISSDSGCIHYVPKNLPEYGHEKNIKINSSIPSDNCYNNKKLME